MKPSQIRRHADRLRGREDGFVMAIVLVLLSVSLVIALAAVAETIDTRTHANLDSRQRRALQAADAGIQGVLYRQNELDLGSVDLTGGSSTISTLPVCMVPNLTSGLPATLTARPTSPGGACPVARISGADAPYSTSIPVGDHDAYSAEFIPNLATLNGTAGIEFAGGKIVSVGIDDNGHVGDPNRYVYERAQATVGPLVPDTQIASGTPGSPLTGGYTGGNPFTGGPPVTILSPDMIEANHDLTFKMPAGATAFNGSARAGDKLYFDLQNLSLVGAFTATSVLNNGNIIEPAAIDVGCPGNAGPNSAYTILNKNPLLSVFTATVLGGFNVASPNTCGGSSGFFSRPAISISSSKADCPSSCSSLGSAYNSSNDEVYNVNPLTTITLAPGDYVFCAFQTNGPVNITANSSSVPLRIFIDKPSGSRCSGKSFSGSAGSFTASQGIGGLIGGVVTTLFPGQVQIYLAGNGTNDGTTATIGPSSVANGFYLYAPTSRVSASSLGALNAAIAGYDVTVSTTAYNQLPALDNDPVSGGGSYSTSGGSSGGGSGGTGGSGGGSSGSGTASNASGSGVFHIYQYVQCSAGVTSLSGTAYTDTNGC